MSNRSFLSESFNAAPEATSYQIITGTFIATVDEVELKTSRNDPELEFLNWKLKIISDTDGDAAMADRLLFRSNFLPKPGDEQSKINQQLGFLKKDLKTAGIDIYAPDFDIVDFLENRLGELLDVNLEVTAKVKKNRDGSDGQNVYINKQVEWDEAECEWVEVPPFEMDSAAEAELEPVATAAPASRGGTRRPAATGQRTAARRPQPSKGDNVFADE